MSVPSGADVHEAKTLRVADAREKVVAPVAVQIAAERGQTPGAHRKRIEPLAPVIVRVHGTRTLTQRRDEQIRAAVAIEIEIAGDAEAEVLAERPRHRPDHMLVAAAADLDDVGAAGRTLEHAHRVVAHAVAIGVARSLQGIVGIEFRSPMQAHDAAIAA
jgi:hypothetical protein